MARGRPSRMTEHFDVVELDGRPPRSRTIADAILDLLRAGNYIETACWVVGISPRTMALWMTEGAKARDRLAAGAAQRALTAHQRRCADFFLAVRAAQSTAEVDDLRRLELLARGGLPIVKQTVKVEIDADGQERVVERTTTTTRSLPDARALMWRLERKFPDRWGRQPAVDEAEGEGDDDEFGADPVGTVRRMLTDIARRNSEVMAELTAGGHEDILDAEIVDERPPELRDE